MQIPVLVEPLADNSYRAKAGEAWSLTAEGPTADEAVRNLRSAIEQRLERGQQLVAVEVPQQNPWLAMAGMHDPNDPMVQRWKEEVAAYRMEVEEDPNRP